MTKITLQLIPGEELKSRRLFETDREYQDFEETLQMAVKAELDLQREARRQSEERAKRHLVS